MSQLNSDPIYISVAGMKRMKRKKGLNKPSKFYCSICERPFKRKSNLENHNTTVHAKVVDKFKCPFYPKCLKKSKNIGGLYSNISNLRVHFEKHHKNKNLDENNLKTIKIKNRKNWSKKTQSSSPSKSLEFNESEIDSGESSANDSILGISYSSSSDQRLESSTSSNDSESDIGSGDSSDSSANGSILGISSSPSVSDESNVASIPSLPSVTMNEHTFTVFEPINVAESNVDNYSNIDEPINENEAVAPVTNNSIDAVASNITNTQSTTVNSVNSAEQKEAIADNSNDDPRDINAVKTSKNSANNYKLKKWKQWYILALLESKIRFKSSQLILQ